MFANRTRTQEGMGNSLKNRFAKATTRSLVGRVVADRFSKHFRRIGLADDIRRRLRFVKRYQSALFSVKYVLVIRGCLQKLEGFRMPWCWLSISENLVLRVHLALCIGLENDLVHQ